MNRQPKFYTPPLNLSSQLWLSGSCRDVGADLGVCPGEHPGSPLPVEVRHGNSQRTSTFTCQRQEDILQRRFAAFDFLDVDPRARQCLFQRFGLDVEADRPQVIARQADALDARHARWGDGNGHSHMRASLLGPSLTIPFVDGRLTLGTWQQIIYVDFDTENIA